MQGSAVGQRASADGSTERWVMAANQGINPTVAGRLYVAVKVQTKNADGTTNSYNYPVDLDTASPSLDDSASWIRVIDQGEGGGGAGSTIYVLPRFWTVAGT